jgi:hypothetical protein
MRLAAITRAPGGVDVTSTPFARSGWRAARAWSFGGG